MNVFVMLWPNGKLVAALLLPNPHYAETTQMKDALVYTDLEEAKGAAHEQGWEIGVLECKLTARLYSSKGKWVQAKAKG